MDALASFFGSFGFFFSSDPAIFTVQLGLVMVGILVIFLVLFATRDILLRTDSFWIQMLCIMLVAALPVVGFLVYLLVRPAMTLRDRKMLRMMEKILSKSAQHQNQQQKKAVPREQGKQQQLIAQKSDR